MLLLRSTDIFFSFVLLASFSAAEAQLIPFPTTLFSACESGGKCSTCNDLLLAVNAMIKDVNNFNPPNSPLSYILSSTDCTSLQNFQSTCVTPCSSLSWGCKNAVASLRNSFRLLMIDYQSVAERGTGGGITPADVAVARGNLACFPSSGVRSSPPRSSVSPKPIAKTTQTSTKVNLHHSKVK